MIKIKGGARICQQVIMFAVIAMEVGMHRVQYVMEIEEEMDICQMEKSAICVREKQWFGVLYVRAQEKLKIRKIQLQNEKKEKNGIQFF